MARQSAAWSMVARPGWRCAKPISRANWTGASRARRAMSRSAASRIPSRFSPGVFEGKTTGTPIALLIRNQDQRSKDYGNIAETFRPGHADYTYTQKYGFRDYRGGGRSSARETAVRVAAGAIARKWLAERYGVSIRGWMSAARTDRHPVRDPPPTSMAMRSSHPTPRLVPELESYMDEPAQVASIRSARRSPLPRPACRRAGASRFMTGWMPRSPTR